MEQTARDAAKLLERNRVGAILRVFSNTPDSVGAQVDSSMDAVRRLLALRAGERAVFSRIDLLVSSDPDFEDTDCGLTAARLREVVKAELPDAPVFVSEIKKGDIYCMLLNYGVASQLEDRIAYSFILSHLAGSYATKENIDGLLSAMFHKARVAGIAIRELEVSISRGRIINTCAMWHNKSLATVGGFDLRAAKPALVHVHEREKVTAWSDTKALRHGDGTVEYHVAGCEEIIPLVRFVRFFGKSIRVVEAKGEGISWKEADEKIDPKGYHRHLANLATKEQRQAKMAATEGVDLEFIERGLMDPQIDSPSEIE